MSGYTIEILKDPANPTIYGKGTTLTYEGATTPEGDPVRMLVIGEDDEYLHTFNPNGDYYGIRKKLPNLECLVRVSQEDSGDGQQTV